jgi:hypothetical protein
MQILIVLAILLGSFFIGYLLFKGKKKPAVTVPEVVKEESQVTVETPTISTSELENQESKKKQPKLKAVKNPKTKSVKKEIAVKKEKKSKDKGNDMLLS